SGAPGNNTTAQNNVLVVGSGGAVDAAGGKLVFRFASPVHVESVDLLNVAKPGGTIRLFDAAGKLLGTTRIPLGGRNSLQRVELPATKGLIGSMEVRLTNDAGIASVAYRYADLKEVTHVAKKVGTQTIKATLSDDDGASVSLEQTVQVLPPLPG